MACGTHGALAAVRLRSVRGLYLGWTGKYNVGDDAMFEVCQEVLARLALLLARRLRER